MTKFPLEGIRVVDLSHAWAAPHATRVMADFGAEVIRVEYPGRLCLLRGGRKDNKAYNNQPAWSHINRNKYSLSLDLKKDVDREILRDLVKRADVFVENGRTGVIDKLGFGYQDLLAIKPDIIMLSMAGFGNTGPYRHLAGYGATFETMSGIQNFTAYDKASKPNRIKEMDILNGIAATAAIMTALFHRRRTGEGQHIDFSHMEAASHALIGEHMLEYVANGTRTLPLGNRHPVFAPQGCYPCGGEDEWVVLTIRTDEEWLRLCKLMGQPELGRDSRFSSASARMKNHDELDRIIAGWTTGFARRETLDILQKEGIPSGAVLDPAGIGNDPHLAERSYFVEGVAGSAARSMGVPFRMGGGKWRVEWGGPELGRDNEQIVCGMLGRNRHEVPSIREEDIRTAYDVE